MFIKIVHAGGMVSFPMTQEGWQHLRDWSAQTTVKLGLVECGSTKVSFNSFGLGSATAANAWEAVLEAIDAVLCQQEIAADKYACGDAVTVANHVGRALGIVCPPTSFDSMVRLAARLVPQRLL